MHIRAAQPGEHRWLSEIARLAKAHWGYGSAELAAWHSKAGGGGKVDVHVCRVADVSKPRGYPPGKVLLQSWRRVRVYRRS